MPYLSPGGTIFPLMLRILLAALVRDVNIEIIAIVEEPALQ